MSHVTSEAHVAMTAAMVVGIAAVVVAFAIGIIWSRKARKTGNFQQLRRGSCADKELDVVMSYSRPHDISLPLPQPPPCVYDPGVKTLRPCLDDLAGWSPREFPVPQCSDSSPRQETEIRRTSLSSLPPVTNESNVLDKACLSRVRSIPPFTPPLNDGPESDNQALGNFQIRSQTPATTHVAMPTMDHSLTSNLEKLLTAPTPRSFLPSPPPTPTHDVFNETYLYNIYDPELDITYRFPLPPPSPKGSKLTVMTRFSQCSLRSTMENVEQGNDDYVIWSDIFSLEDYGQEDQRFRSHSSINVRNQLASPPPTPTVVFTPPSPRISESSSTSTPAEVDEQRLHACTASRRSSEDEESGEQDRNDDGSLSLRGEMTAFDLAYEQGKAARPRRAKIEPHPGVMNKSHIRDDRPPAYQSLGFDYESRLVQKRVSSPFADTPAHGQPKTRNFLEQMATVVRPRPPLEDFQPLLCRKIKSPNFPARRELSGILGHRQLSYIPKPRERVDFGAQMIMYTPADVLRAIGDQTEEHTVADVMGIAV